MKDIPKTMHAVLLTDHGGLEKLEYKTDIPVPVPESDEVEWEDNYPFGNGICEDNETIFDCGQDGLCEGDLNWPGPDSGEGDGILICPDSGEDGNEDFEGLIEKLAAIEHYQELFKLVYGDSEITEERIQLALAQFIRSIQSFDSKYDVGRAQVNSNNQSFPNFTEEENMGKQLFTARPDFDLNGVRIGGGAGCEYVEAHKLPCRSRHESRGPSRFQCNIYTLILRKRF